MSIFTRIWRYLKALINGKMDEWEDPEIILKEAVREMREVAAKNKELAVQAITQKNNLQAEVEKEERLIAELERRATIALQGGNRELAKQFLKEKAMHDQTIENLRTELAKAVDASEKVKIAIRAQEDKIRQRTAESLALKAKLKQAQIQNSISKALDGIQLSETDGAWATANERITAMQSEAQARTELAANSIDSKIRDMELSQMDVEADHQLAQLEEKLQMGGVNANRYTTNTPQQIQTVGGGGATSSNGASAPESDIDRQLRELEDKLGKR